MAKYHNFHAIECGKTDSDRPVIRMTPEAAEIYKVRQAAQGEEGEET